MVTTASLAGVASRALWEMLPPNDRERAEELHDRLRNGRSREGLAQALAVLRAALDRPGEGAIDPRLGARLYARWIRSLTGAERVHIVRALDVQSMELVREVLPQCGPLDEDWVEAAACVVAFGARELGRLPTVHELTCLLAFARGTVDVCAEPIVRWERSLRVVGRQAAIVSLATLVGGEG